jgi:hypothetical protein
VIDPEKIVRKVLEAIGPKELERVRVTIGSSTLRNALRLIIVESEARANLFIPHYWAVFYHDGHGTILPRKARKLVFFDDPNDDPRLNSGESPERAADLRRLTEEQYREGLRRNRDRAARGERPFMYVVDSLGPRKPTPFFEQFRRGAAARSADTIRNAFQEELLRQIFEDPETRGESGSIEFRL